MRTKHFWDIVVFCVMAQTLILCCRVEAFTCNLRARESIATHSISPQVSLSTTTIQDSFALSVFINMFNTQPSDKIFQSEFTSKELARMDTLAPDQIELALGHIYTVGDHSRNVLRALDEISEFEKGSLLDAYQNVNLSGKMWVLRVAALFHDCGKGADHDLYLMHPAKGANKILALLENIQIKLDTSDIKMLRWLILFHDHMSFLASKRDIYDEDTLIEFMHYLERFSPDDAELALNMLYLLSYADATGINMEGATHLYRTLMQSLPTLYSSMRNYLSENRVNGPQDKDTTAKKIAFLASLTPDGVNETHLREYLEITPEFLIAPHRAIHIKKQLTLLINANETPQLVVQKLLGDNFTRQLEITVVTKHSDTIGLLSRLTAIFYLNNLNIRTAEINMTQQGIVFDRFVATYSDSVMTDWTISDLHRNIEEDMDRVFKQGMSLEKLFDTHNQPYAFPILNHPFYRFKTKTSFYPMQNSTQMVLETTDRDGVLHLVSRALFKIFHINILSVDISTEEYKVMDTFLLEHKGRALSETMIHEVGNYIEKLLDSVNGNSADELQELIAPSIRNASGIITNTSITTEQAI